MQRAIKGETAQADRVIRVCPIVAKVDQYLGSPNNALQQAAATRYLAMTTKTAVRTQASERRVPTGDSAINDLRSQKEDSYPSSSR